MREQGTLIGILIAIVGGGGIAPFAWKLWVRLKPAKVEVDKARAEIEAISSTAANESVEMMRGVLQVLREQVQEGLAANESLRAERIKDREEIRRLREKINELAGQVRALGGEVDGLEPGVA